MCARRCRARSTHPRSIPSRNVGRPDHVLTIRSSSRIFRYHSGNCATVNFAIRLAAEQPKGCYLLLINRPSAACESPQKHKFLRPPVSGCRYSRVQWGKIGCDDLKQRPPAAKSATRMRGVRLHQPSAIQTAALRNVAPGCGRARPPKHSILPTESVYENLPDRTHLDCEGLDIASPSIV